MLAYFPKNVIFEVTIPLIWNESYFLNAHFGTEISVDLPKILAEAG